VDPGRGEEFLGTRVDMLHPTCNAVVHSPDQHNVLNLSSSPRCPVPPFCLCISTEDSTRQCRSCRPKRFQSVYSKVRLLLTFISASSSSAVFFTGRGFLARPPPRARRAGVLPRTGAAATREASETIVVGSRASSTFMGRSTLCSR
jgi:hypothetical protein